MSIAKTIAHQAETIRGSFKKMTGRATRNIHLRAEGRGDQVKGNARQAGAKVRAAFRH